jgi:teichuronic acid biosynthesis glycosyltransferase TuaC
LKVLLVTTSYPAHDEDPSGHFVRAEARQLAGAGHDVQVIAPLNKDAAWTAVDASTSVVVHRVGCSELFGWPGAIARVKTNPLRLLHAGRFFFETRRRIALIGRVERVIGHWIVPAGVPLLVDHPAPLEVVGHGADVRLLCSLPRALRLHIVNMLLDRGARFRFVASMSLQTLGSKLPPSLERRLVAASYVEPAAIDVPDVGDRVAEIRRSMRVYPDGFVVTVGRLIDLKRIDLALAAAALARVPIVVIGDGPLRSDLERFAKRTGVQALFKGLLTRTETLAWIAASRVLVHASRAEGAPTVVREARMLGVPVVATAAGDIEAWAEKDLGIGIVDARVEALGSAIAAVFSRDLEGHEIRSRQVDR